MENPVQHFKVVDEFGSKEVKAAYSSLLEQDLINREQAKKLNQARQAANDLPAEAVELIRQGKGATQIEARLIT